MSVENGVSKNGGSRRSLKGKWVDVRYGIGEVIQIETVHDLINNGLKNVSAYSVREEFGPEAGEIFSKWLGEHQPKNGK